MALFSYYNVSYYAHPVENCVVAKGYIRNESNRSYTTAVFLAKIFNGSETVGSAYIKLHGFETKKTKAFEVKFENALAVDMPKISRCEIFMESAF
jgi:hypothetical protein